MTVICLACGKGGTAKSTLCAYLAVEASAQGLAPVVIVDTDPQGSPAPWWNSRAAETPLFASTDMRRATMRARRTLPTLDAPLPSEAQAPIEPYDPARRNQWVYSAEEIRVMMPGLDLPPVEEDHDQDLV
jgi:cellulose biosynthesis protein BcsQ